MGWVTSLENHIVSCDTAPVIYYIETNPAYITLLKVLIHPLRHGNTALAQQYELLLNGTRNVQVISVSSVIAQTAARIRATYHLRMPDAIQIATAIEQGSMFFVTNDPIFKRVPDISVIVLDDLP